MALSCSLAMAVTQTTSSAGDLGATFLALLLLFLLLLLSWCLLRLQEANRMLQERILSLEKDVMWWKDHCMWFQFEYDRRHASPRAGDWDVRISSSLTQNEAWTFLHIPLWSLGWCLSACPICKRPLELTVWDANSQGRTYESGVPAEDLQLSAWKGLQEAKK